MEIVQTKIMPNGEIKLPPEILKGWGVKVGEEIKIKTKGQQVILFPSDGDSKIFEQDLKPIVRPFEKNSSLNKMEDILRKTIEDFTDEISRQNFFIGFKSQVSALWRRCEDEDSYFAVILSLLDDTLHLTKSNEVTHSQLNALLKVVKIMKNIELNQEDITRCETILLDSGLKTVPEIEGLTDIYTSED